MNTKNICVYDYETDSPKPHECSPVQLGAMIIHPIKLEFLDKAEFNSDMRPPDIDDDDYFDKHKDTIEWHSRISKCSTDDVIKRWKDAPMQKDVWETFNSWLSRYHTKQDRQTIFTAPIECGYNIIKFDSIITNRICIKYGNIQKDGTPKIFYPRDKIDMIQVAFWWFENQNEPKSYTLDSLREYFGLCGDDAHDALQDVRDTGVITCRLLKAQRWLTTKLLEQKKLKGAFKDADKNTNK